jgi:hypothetical protein
MKNRLRLVKCLVPRRPWERTEARRHPMQKAREEEEEQGHLQLKPGGG